MLLWTSGHRPPQPDFLIIGAQKAGTSALYDMLSRHPQIVPSKTKEVHYFDGLSISYGDTAAYAEHFPAFPDLQPEQLTFEASPSYLVHPQCAARIYEFSPTIRLIAVLRDPVERAYSAWNMYRNFRSSDDPRQRRLAETREFKTAIAEEINAFDRWSWKRAPIAYLRRGLYAEQLERYLELFPRSSLLILEHQQLRTAAQHALLEIQTWLGLAHPFPSTDLQSNVSRYSSSPQADVNAVLGDFFRPHNERLFTLLKKRYSWTGC